MTTAFITGASRGIGKSIALRLAELGHGVFLLGRDETALKAVVAQCADKGAVAGLLCGDLADAGYIDATVAAAGDLLGPVDVLVNNAGFAAPAAVHEADLTLWQSVLDVNLGAAIHLCRSLVPGMVARERGSVINIASLSGRHTGPGDAIYAATKHAMIGFTGCLYEDVREYGIKVSTILPGFVETELTANLGLDTSKMIRPDDVADAVALVLSSSPACCPTEIVLRPQRRP